MDVSDRRAADNGDGTFRNPVLPGDRPDPSVVWFEDAYYLTFSSFDSAPGLQVWRSIDLVSWEFVTCALPQPASTVFAPDLIVHDGRMYLYFPYIPSAWSKTISEPQIWVTHADRPEGPWAEPVFTGIRGAIDPGHVVDDDGGRHLFVNGIRRCRLSDDGLTAVTPLEHAYDGWQYPEEWITEAYALEGPKFFRRDGWIYLVSAVGGTAGPATGHMVIVARSRSVEGPWENSPHNPVARTTSREEAWWSRGHATILAVGEEWWMLSHGYAQRWRTLGRQVLLEPISWTPDGWPVSAADPGSDLPVPVAGGPRLAVPAPHDDFAAPAWGRTWVFDDPAADEQARATFGVDGLVLRGKGDGVATSSPLTTWAMDRRYTIEAELTVSGGTEGGLLLFFNGRMFCGMGWDGSTLASYAGGIRTHHREPVAGESATISLRLVNDDHIVTGYHRLPGGDWVRHGVRYDTEGYHAATLNDLKSLRPALYATGGGEVRVRSFDYRAGVDR